MSILLNWVILAALIMLTAAIIPGVGVDGFVTALWVALIMGVINWTIKPLLSLLTLPLNFLSFGLFSFVINALMFGLAAYLVGGFQVSGVISALLGSILLGFLAGLILPKVSKAV